VLRWSAQVVGRAGWVEELSEVGKGDAGKKCSEDYRECRLKKLATVRKVSPTCYQKE
jgi:hypothetical protein